VLPTLPADQPAHLASASLPLLTSLVRERVFGL